MIHARIADLADPQDRAGMIAMLRMYHAEPMGAACELPMDRAERVAREVAARPGALVIVAWASPADRAMDPKAPDATNALTALTPAGYCLCFEGYSSFAAAPLINLHDVAVAPAFRGQGVVKMMFDAIEAEARRRGCARLTLEVREDNIPAIKAYKRFGFEFPEPKEWFMKKSL